MAVRTHEAVGAGEDSLARGTLALVGVQFTFLVGGYVVHFYLGRRLGPADYGAFGVVMAFLVWMEASLTGGFPYAIRKFGAERRDLMPAVARAAMRGQLVYSTALLAAALISAPWIARLLHDPGMTNLIRLASIDIPIYAFYFSYTAVLNGRRNYGKQAAAMMSYAGAKVVAILLLVMFGLGVRGALVGNIVASAGGLAAAAVLAGRLPKVDRYPIRKLISYAGGTAALAVCFTLLISIDMFIVKAMSPVAATVGYYTAANTLARAPFYVLLGIATATLPAISRAASEADGALIRQYVRQALRLHLVLLAPVTAILSGTAPGTVGLLYTGRYASAAPALAVLAVAVMFFGFIHALFNILVALGDTRTPLLGTTILIVIAVALNVVLVPKWGMMGAAIASMATAGMGLLASGIMCRQRLGTLISPVRAIKVIVAAAAVYWAARLLPAQGAPQVGLYIVLFVLYFAALVATGEITRNDMSKVATAIGLR